VATHADFRAVIERYLEGRVGRGKFEGHGRVRLS
jgi:hypothetical protein